MKFMTTRWRMMLAKIKSANALSGEIPLKSEQLAGLLCTRRQTPKTKDPTQEINPDRNELNGKVPTKQQYTN